MIKASLLDRLIDTAANHNQIQNIVYAVQRDLENLLNTRLPMLDEAKTYTEKFPLKKSLINYGMPDFSSIYLESQSSRFLFCQTLKEKIQLFEPRLKNIHVEFLPVTDPFDRVLRLRIEGTLLIDAVNEPIILDSVIHPQSTNFDFQKSLEKK